MDWRFAATAAGWVRSRTGLYGEILSCLSENSVMEWRKKGWRIFLTYEKKKKRGGEEKHFIGQRRVDGRALDTSSDTGRSQKV